MDPAASESLLDALDLLSSESRQWDFERARPLGSTRDALLAQVPSDTGEAMAILEAYVRYVERIGRELPEELIAMQHDARWQEAMSMAKEALRALACGERAPRESGEIPPNPVGSWEDYFESMSRMPRHPLYDVLDRYLPAGGQALELGCGYGHGVQHLLACGFEVWATDIQGQALRGVFERTPAERRPRIHTRVADIARMAFEPNAFDVVVAAFCLFFVPKEALDRKWPEIGTAIRPDGLLMGQLLGPRDDWAAQGYTTHTRSEVQALLEPFEVLHLEEAERDGATSTGTKKHWHVFHFVVRRLAG